MQAQTKEPVAVNLAEDATSPELVVHDDLTTTVVLVDCPQCGSNDLRGSDFAYCASCGWEDVEAAHAAHEYQWSITEGAL
jgi:predicted RNA-binding Zn-ribbon protein involved in translation (DUF1610 family)